MVPHYSEKHCLKLKFQFEIYVIGLLLITSLVWLIYSCIAFSAINFRFLANLMEHNNDIENFILIVDQTEIRLVHILSSRMNVM